MNQTTPTLQDVAREAGVSTATVSRCLNSPDRVVAETRIRVMAAVERLGYLPNLRARALVSGRSQMVGAIIPTMENAIFARGIQAFQEELGDHGFTLLIASSSYRSDLEAGQVRNLVSRGADALLLIGHERDDDVYRFLEQKGIPVLVAWVHDRDRPQPSVGFDNLRAMQALAAKVIDVGHRRIGVISAPLASNDRARQRVEGIRAAMRDAGLDPGSLRIVETTYGIETGGSAFAELMGPSDRPTAVMCGNDVLAAGALQRAKEMGLKVPGDVSITGFDDLVLAQVIDPALTTVHVPHREMGRTAARALVRRLQGGEPLVGAELETTLCLRASLAPPPSMG